MRPFLLSPMSVHTHACSYYQLLIQYNLIYSLACVNMSKISSKGKKVKKQKGKTSYYTTTQDSGE